jgi:hypothetical protein
MKKILPIILILAILSVCIIPDHALSSIFTALNDHSRIAIIPTTAGLVAYYPFDSDYQDHSGNNNHGTPKGNMAFVPGKVSQAASFDEQSWIEVPDNDLLDLTNAFTFALWVYKEDNGKGGFSVIICKGDTYTIDNNAPYALFHTYDGLYPAIRMTKDNIYSDMYFTTRAPDFKKWYHLAVTWDGKTATLYMDGAMKDSRNWEGPLPTSTSKLLIGYDPTGWAEYFHGFMDEVRIYNISLTPNEIADLAGITLPPTPTSIPTTTPTLVPAPSEIQLPTLPPTQTTTSIPTPTPTTTISETPSSTTLPPSLIPSITTTSISPSASSLTFESRNKKNGSMIQIPLTLKGAKEKIGNIDLTLTYDPSVLKAHDTIKGSLTANSIFDYNAGIPGTIKISLADKAGFEGDGSVAYVIFTVVGTAGTSSLLKIASVIANRAGDMIEVKLATQDGTFKVLGNEQLKGDFDGDGKLTALDALAALQMAVEKRAVEMSMDITGDSKITSADALQILKEAVAQAPAISQPTSVGPVRTLSDEQQRVVDMFGWPHSFSLIAIEDNDNKLHCSETWTYYDGQITYFFLDGKYRTWEPAESLPDGSVATPYRPDEFMIGSSVQEVKKAILPGDEFLRVQEADYITEGIIDEAEMYAAPQLISSFYEGRLVILEALALTPEGEE